jgi:hypothetical protein
VIRVIIMVLPQVLSRLSVVAACWTDLRCVYRLRHAVEDRDALAAASGREYLVGVAEAAVDILPVVHQPDVARRIDGTRSAPDKT